MPAVTRAQAEANRRTTRQLGEVGEEFRERRLALNLSQHHVSVAARMSRRHYGRIERGLGRSLTLDELNRIAVVLGMSPSVRLYPDGPPVRDRAHAERLQTFLAHVRGPLAYRAEVPLPIVEGRPERRAWDAVIFNGRERCAVELEMRLRDVQAVLRRIDLKRRDDPTARFLLLVADTRLNRRVVDEFHLLFADLPRLRPSAVRASFAASQLPPTGMLLV
jgi:transcriptional regulator with XRE-family HTH domain